MEEQVTSAASRPAKTELIRQAILGKPDSFTLADATAELPLASPQLIKKVLAELKQKTQVKLVGRGRGAIWRVVR